MPCTVMLFSPGITSVLFARRMLCSLSVGGNIIAALISDELSRSEEPPFEFRRVPRYCRVSSPTPPAPPVTKSICSIHPILLTASRPASSQKFHVYARRLLSFAASLSVPLQELPQLAHSISPCTQKEPLD